LLKQTAILEGNGEIAKSFALEQQPIVQQVIAQGQALHRDLGSVLASKRFDDWGLAFAVVSDNLNR
jgi:hypothetical protein